MIQNDIEDFLNYYYYLNERFFFPAAISERARWYTWFARSLWAPNAEGHASDFLSASKQTRNVKECIY